MKHIFYKSDYKYQLSRDYAINTSIYPVKHFNNRYISLNTEGMLIIKAGYSWDGPSGPTVDTKNFMRGSLVHDVLYQIIREGGLGGGAYRELADKLLREICKDDGMNSFRAWYVYKAVRLFGKSSSVAKKEIVKAP